MRRPHARGGAVSPCESKDDVCRCFVASLGSGRTLARHQIQTSVIQRKCYKSPAPGHFRGMYIVTTRKKHPYMEHPHEHLAYDSLSLPLSPTVQQSRLPRLSIRPKPNRRCVPVPKPPKGLTLYNASGDVVARCGRQGDSFGDCKMEPGVSLDEVMNAWVHAYQDSQK